MGISFKMIYLDEAINLIQAKESSKITLQTAKHFYKSNDERVKQFALDNYSIEQLKE